MRAVVIGCLALGGCAGDGPAETDGDVDLTPEQGVAVRVRDLDGARVPGARVLVGADRAEPDSAGFTYFFSLLPGLVIAGLDLDDQVKTFVTPEVETDFLSGGTLSVAPAQSASVPDAAVAHTLVGDGWSIEVPAGAVAVGDTALSGPYDVLHTTLTSDSAALAPGRMIAVTNDDDLAPIVLDHVFHVAGRTPDGAGVTLLQDASLTFELPPGSPVDDDPAWRLYAFSTNRGLWTRGAIPEIDVGTGTLTGELPIFGWWGVGRDADVAEAGCVSGTVVDPDGQPLTGPEVQLHEAGRAAVDRRTAIDGTFCMPITPGAEATIEVFGLQVDRSRLFTATLDLSADDAIGACGSPACTDLGAVSVEAWADADGDRYFAGPGGDCDDGDGSINPSPAQGDGSWCGDGP